MKKIIIALLLSLTLVSTVACEDISDEPVSVQGEVTIQNESPTEQIFTETTETASTIATSEQITTENIPAVTPSQTEVNSESEKKTETSSTTKKETTAKPTETTVTTVQTTTATVATTTETTTAVTTEKVTEKPVISEEPDIIDDEVIINPTGYSALNFREQKGVWISFLEFQRILENKSESQFRKEVCRMYDNCKNLGINTVYVHARGHGDAYYKSTLFPWSEYVCGKVGVAPDFDPYKILVDEAHKRGLSFHAWINPMRALKDDDLKNLSDKYPIKKWYNDSSKRGKYIVNVKGRWYYNPAYKDARKLICDGIKEILSNYNVDGIHIDDYFYPTPENYFDDAAFKSSGATNRSQWRLDTVSNLVSDMYRTVKSTNSTALFGISPAGNIKNNYECQFADVRRWASHSGYMDYLVPQIYFGYHNKFQPYESNLQVWCDMVTNPNVKLVVGLASYKVGDSEWDKEGDSPILARQVNTFKEKSKYGGAAFFRYDSMFMPLSSVSKKVDKEMDALKEVLK